VAATHAEIFSILEVGHLNNAAVPEYERVAKALAASLRKAYTRENPDAFENAVAGANQALASTAADGTPSWAGRINILLAARSGSTLSVATCGKVHAYLLRASQLSDLADSPEKQNPLKVLENFAVGKVQKGDFLIFSTPQLFNYVSAERVQALLASLPLGAACDSIAALIRENADEQTSFGTLILELGHGDEFAQQDVGKMAAVLAGSATLASQVQAAWAKVRALFNHTVLIARDVRPSSIKNITNLTADAVREHAKKYTDLEKLRSLPRAKKFFLAAALACVVLLVANVALAIRSENAKKAAAALSQQLTTVSGEINNANSAFMYGDSATASQLLGQAQSNLAKVPAADANTTQVAQLKAEAGQMANAINHVDASNAVQLVSYSGASIDTFVVAGSTAYLINKAGDLFVPYSLTDGNGKAANSFTIAAPPVTNVATINGAVIFTDGTGALYQLNAGSTTPAKQAAHLPAGSTGLAFYGTPTRAYTVDKANSAIVSTTFASTKAPAGYLRQSANLSSATSVAIDGSVYVLNSTGIQKFTTGTLRAYSSPSFTLSSSATIFTAPALNSLYVLDTQNNAVDSIDKVTGKILEQYKPANVKTIQAFAVDASSPSSPVIYVLSNQTLYKLAP
jgi:hypothetical protein